mgnify:CR=1 FL=1
MCISGQKWERFCRKQKDIVLCAWLICFTDKNSISKRKEQIYFILLPENKLIVLYIAVYADEQGSTQVESSLE